MRGCRALLITNLHPTVIILPHIIQIRCHQGIHDLRVQQGRDQVLVDVQGRRAHEIGPGVGLLHPLQQGYELLSF